MHADVVARSHGADAVKNILMAGFAWNGVDHDIRIGQDIVDGAGNLAHHLARALESYIARQSNRQVGKVAIAGTANARPFDLNYAVDLERLIHDAVAITG